MPDPTMPTGKKSFLKTTNDVLNDVLNTDVKDIRRETDLWLKTRTLEALKAKIKRGEGSQEMQMKVDKLEREIANTNSQIQENQDKEEREAVLKRGEGIVADIKNRGGYVFLKSAEQEAMQSIVEAEFWQKKPEIQRTSDGVILTFESEEAISTTHPLSKVDIRTESDKKIYREHLIIRHNSEGEVVGLEAPAYYLPREVILKALVDLEEGKLPIPEIPEEESLEIQKKKDQIKNRIRTLEPFYEKLANIQSRFNTTGFKDIKGLSNIEKEFSELFEDYESQGVLEVFDQEMNFGEMFKIDTRNQDSNSEVHDTGFNYVNSQLLELDIMINNIRELSSILQSSIDRRKSRQNQDNLE